MHKPQRGMKIIHSSERNENNNFLIAAPVLAALECGLDIIYLQVNV